MKNCATMGSFMIHTLIHSTEEGRKLWEYGDHKSGRLQQNDSSMEENVMYQWLLIHVA